MNAIQHAVEIITSSLNDVQAIYQFGSYDTPLETPESDLDLAILIANAIDKTTLWDLSQDIAIAIHRDVDLIDLRRAPTIFQHEIISSGQRIYTHKEHITMSNLFEVFVDHKYLDFIEARASMIDDIRKRGSIYDR